jgi:hypothetical protein
MKKEEINLIKGEFTPIEAQEIINHIIDKKIQFHNIKNFSDQIRFGKVDEDRLERIKELEESKKDFQKTILGAIDEGKKMRIKSIVEIEYI